MKQFGITLAAFLTVKRFLLVLFLSRLLMLVLLYGITGGQELSNDTHMHMTMLRSPWCILIYQYPGWEQNPPFLPFLEALFGYPAQLFFSDFISLRFVMICYEVIVGLLFYRLLTELHIKQERLGFCLLGFLILPMGWMVSVVMAQDETIASAAFLLPLLLFLSGRPRTALLFCGLGVVSAKIFIILEYCTLLAFCPKDKRVSGAVIGLLPIAIVYSGISLHRLLHGYPLPLTDFHPDPYFGTNFWIVLETYGGLSLLKYGPYSGLLAGLASLIPAFIIFVKAEGWDKTHVVVAATASLTLFLSLFYHVNPEYFIMVFPPMLAITRNFVDVIYDFLVSFLPWAGKLFQVAQFKIGLEENKGRVVAVEVYSKLFPVSPEYLLVSTQLLFSIITLALAFRWCFRLFEPPMKRL